MNVAVVGAGISGLCAVKNLLDYGYNVTCYEGQKCLGGKWLSAINESYDRDTNKLTGTNSMCSGLKTNSSTQANCFSDFPSFHKSKLNTPYEIYDYLIAYCEKFELKSHIKFECTVQKISKSDDYSSDKPRWDIEFKSRSDDEETESFDRVFVTTGLFRYPREAQYGGLDSLSRGMALHVAYIRDFSAYRGKTVLVVGGGISAGDAVAQLLHEGARKVLWSAKRRPEGNIRSMDVIKKSGRPWDWDVSRMTALDPNRLIQSLELRSVCDEKFDDSKYDRVTAHTIEGIYLFDEIQSGVRLQLVDSIEKFLSFDFSVELKNGMILPGINNVVFAIGYNHSLPFLEHLRGQDELFDAVLDYGHLYKHCIVPGDFAKGLYFPGWAEGTASKFWSVESHILLILELWAKDEWTDASDADMLSWIEELKSKSGSPETRFVSSPRLFQGTDANFASAGYQPRSPYFYLLNPFSKLYR